MQSKSQSPTLSWCIPKSGKYIGYLIHGLNAINVPNYLFLIVFIYFGLL